MSKIQKMYRELPEKYRELLKDLKNHRYCCYKHDSERVYLTDLNGNTLEILLKTLREVLELGENIEFFIQFINYDPATKEIAFADEVDNQKTVTPQVTGRKQFSRFMNALNQINKYNSKLRLLGKDGAMQFRVNEFTGDIILTNCNDMLGDTVRIPSFVNQLGGSCFKDSKAKYIYIDNSDEHEFKIDKNAFQQFEVSELTIEFNNPKMITDLSSVFRNLSCKKFTLKNFDWSNVEKAKEMFESCQDLEELDIGSGIAYKLQSLEGAFAGCKKLKDTQFLSKLLFPQLINFGYAFRWCTGLEKSDIQTLMIQKNLCDIQSLFSDCWNLREVKLYPTEEDVKHWISLEETSDEKFSIQDELYKTLQDGLVNGFTTIQNLYQTFEKCKKLEIVNLSGLNLTSLVKAEATFEKCESLNTVVLTPQYKLAYSEDKHHNKEKIRQTGQSDRLSLKEFTNMGDMFRECSNIRYVDLSGLDIPKLSVMDSAFIDCKQLVNVKFGNINLPKLQEMESTFENCVRLEELDMSKVNAPNLQWMIRTCYNNRRLRFIKLPERQEKNIYFKGTLGVVRQARASGDIQKRGFFIEDIDCKKVIGTKDNNSSITYIRPVEVYLMQINKQEFKVQDIVGLIYSHLSEKPLVSNRIYNRIEAIHLKDITYTYKDIDNMLSLQV